MSDAYTGTMSQKGQVVIPAAIRKSLGLKKGSKLYFELKGDEVLIKKAPSALDWSQLLKQIPNERVDIDLNGHYDPKKSPDFHDWMVNG